MPRVLVAVALVLLAGCATVAGPTANPTVTPTDAPTATPTPTATSGATPTARDTPTPFPNPWGGETVVVAIRTPADDARDYEPLVREATSYWNQVGHKYGPYELTYRLLPDAPLSEADVVVEFVPTAGEQCDADPHLVGCAPIVEAGDTPDDTVVVEIEQGYTDESTALMLKHELGHVRGLTHDDEPADVMVPTFNTTALPAPNVSDRAWPWERSRFGVFVDAGAHEDPETASQQVERALEYLGGAPKGVPSNVTFYAVDERDRAHFVIEAGYTDYCANYDGSCAQSWGDDPDRDGALEYYTRVNISVAKIDGDAVAWHVAYWIIGYFGNDYPEGYPAPFVDASYEERRGTWWDE